MKVLRIGAVAAAVAFFAAGQAGKAQAAYTCDDSTDGGYSSGCSNQASSNTTIAPAVVGIATRQMVGLVSGRIEAFRASAGGVKSMAMQSDGPALELGTGRAAGGMGKKFGVWLDGSWTDYSDDNAATKSNGDIYTVSLGADYRIRDNLVAGLAIGYENSDITTDFNRGTLEGSGITVAPYVVYNINNMFSVDVNAGYSWLNYDTSRTTVTSSTNSFSGTKNTGSFDADRYFGAANVNVDHSYNNFVFGGSLGVMYAREEQDKYTESDGATIVHGSAVDLGRASIGAKVGYTYKAVTPFVMGSYENDFVNETVNLTTSSGATSSNDDDRYVVGGGINFLIKDAISGGIEGSTTLGEKDVDEVSVRGSVRVEF